MWYISCLYYPRVYESCVVWDRDQNGAKIVLKLLKFLSKTETRMMRKRFKILMKFRGGERRCLSGAAVPDAAPERQYPKSESPQKGTRVVQSANLALPLSNTSCTKARAVIARVVSRCREAEYRVWVKAMANCYPMQAYLQRIELVKSADCPYCPGTKETLAHFASVCPLRGQHDST